MDVVDLFKGYFDKQKGAVATGKVVDAQKQDYDWDGYLERLEMVESSGGKNLKSKTSSASGAHQFTEDTWKDYTKKMGVDYSLEDRFDYKKSREVTKYFSNENKKRLSGVLGRTPTFTELYMAHKLGPTGSNKFFKAKPTTTIDQIVSGSALKANKNVFYNEKGKPRTAAEVFGIFEEKFK